MSHLSVNPKYRDLLAAAGLSSTADFLARPGEPISVRPERRVDRIALSTDLDGYLKKETTIRLRERLSSWWSGYGWSSKSMREAIVLGELAQQKIACPKVLAFGEKAGQSFVLLKEERYLEPLDRFVQRRPEQTARIARLVGRELARIHEAGFFHPDLFAKHVLVGNVDGLDRLCIIDWQRTRRMPHVPWSRRIVDLATLDASLARNAVPAKERLRFLINYLRGTTGRRPSVVKMIAAIRSRAWLLLKQRRVYRQQVASAVAIPTQKTPHDRYDWPNCPLRLTDPRLAVLPLVEFLANRTDLLLRRQALERVGRALHDLHEVGYVPADPGLSSWVVHAAAGDFEILLTSAADLTPTTAPLDVTAARDLARLLARHRSALSRGDLLNVVRGYLGASAPRRVRRDLVRRIVRLSLDAREHAR